LPIERDGGDRFGSAVAMAGDVAVAGAPGENGLGADAGAVYVFRRDRGGPDGWGQVAEVTASGAGNRGDRFGAAVAVHGDRLLVGAPGDRTDGEEAGAVYLFERDQGGPDAWGRVARVRAFDGAPGAAFGHSVSLFSGTAQGGRPAGVAGAPLARGLVEGGGAGYVLAELQGLETHLPTGDSFVRRNQPNRNEGANPGLRVNHSGLNRAVVDFGDLPDVSRLARARLVLTLAESPHDWGREGRPVEAFRIASFVEGNGAAAGIPGSRRTRGTGAGITWNCWTDLAIENERADCGLVGEILGPLADPVLHVNGLRGEVTWDVTADVVGGTRAWMIRKADERRSGEVWYYSREGAGAAANPDLAPRLVLEFATAVP
jgi:hypothetical protein